MVFRTV